MNAKRKLAKNPMDKECFTIRTEKLKLKFSTKVESCMGHRNFGARKGSYLLKAGMWMDASKGKASGIILQASYTAYNATKMASGMAVKSTIFLTAKLKPSSFTRKAT